jgi:hypothetical protein
MYLLNVKLGFQPIPSWLSYKNELAKNNPAGAPARENR